MALASLLTGLAAVALTAVALASWGGGSPGIALPLGFVASLIAIVVGLVSRSATDGSRRGKALVGTVLGTLIVAFWLVVLLLALIGRG